MNETTAIAKTQENNTFGALLTKYAPEFKKIAPDHLDLERVFRLAESARTKNPQLAKCTTASILACLQEGTKLGLEPVGRHGYYLIPFRNSKTGNHEATIIVDYRGLVELVERGGAVKKGTFASFCIHEKDEFEHLEAGAFIHKPTKFARNEEGSLEAVDRGKVVGVYAQVQLKDGSWKKTEPYTVDEIERYRQVSKASKFGPWVDWWDEMAKKTAIRRLCNFLPQSNEVKEKLNVIDDIEYGKPIVEIETEAMAPQSNPATPEVDQKLLDALGGQGGAPALPSGGEPPGPEAGEPQNEAGQLRDRIAKVFDDCTKMWGNEEAVKNAFGIDVGTVKGLRNVEKLAGKLKNAEGLLDKFAVAKTLNQHKKVVRMAGGEDSPAMEEPWTHTLERLQQLEGEWRQVRADSGLRPDREHEGSEPAPAEQTGLGLDEPPPPSDDDDVPWG